MPRNANASRPNAASRRLRAPGGLAKNGALKEDVRAVVMIDAVKGVPWLPETLTCCGETVQVEAGMGSVHDIINAPEKPFSGEACRLNVAVSPAVTVTDVEPLEPRAN